MIIYYLHDTLEHVDNKSITHIANYFFLQLGKKREYDLGSHLRSLYNDFLGEDYTPKKLAARSTEYDRAKMSLQLVLSSLYPPKGTQVWNKYLNWQPIPYTYEPGDNDILMIPEECPQ